MYKLALKTAHAYLSRCRRAGLIIFTGFITQSGLINAEPMELPLLNCRIEPHIIVDVSTAVRGLIESVNVNKNQRVGAGEVLATLEAGVETVTVDLRRFQAELSSDIKAKQLALEFSQRNLQRTHDLFAKKAISYAQVDEAKTEAELAIVELQLAKDRKLQAELEHRRAQENLNRRIITSPISGLVIQRYKEPGEHVEDEPIIQVAQLDPLRVEVYAPVSLYGLISEGMTAEIIPDLPRDKKTYRGEVVMVDQVIDAPSNTFGIRLSFPNPQYHLPSGLKCKVRFPNAGLSNQTEGSGREIAKKGQM